MKRAAILLAALALSGCASTRYVPSPCLTRDEFNELRQKEPDCVRECTKYDGTVQKSDKLTGKADHDIKPVGGSAVRLRGYAHGLLNVLGGCVG